MIVIVTGNRVGKDHWGNSGDICIVFSETLVMETCSLFQCFSRACWGVTAKVGAVGQWLTSVSTLQIKYEWDQNWYCLGNYVRKRNHLLCWGLQNCVMEGLGSALYWCLSVLQTFLSWAWMFLHLWDSSQYQALFLAPLLCLFPLVRNQAQVKSGEAKSQIPHNRYRKVTLLPWNRWASTNSEFPAWGGEASQPSLAPWRIESLLIIRGSSICCRLGSDTLETAVESPPLTECMKWKSSACSEFSSAFCSLPKTQEHGAIPTKLCVPLYSCCLLPFLRAARMVSVGLLQLVSGNQGELSLLSKSPFLESSLGWWLSWVLKPSTTSHGIWKKIIRETKPPRKALKFPILRQNSGQQSCPGTLCFWVMDIFCFSVEK